MAGKPWFNNGIIEIQRNPNKEQIPEGFVRGRIKNDQMSESLKRHYANMSKEEKDIVNMKRSKTMTQIHANMTQEEKEHRAKLQSEGLNNRTEEEKFIWRQNISNNTVGKNKGNIPWNKDKTKETDQRLMLISEHNSIVISAYMKALPPEYFKEWRRKMRETARKNNSYQSSRAEEELYRKLCEQYSSDDVYRQYKDETRYPFDCDFYVKSQDLFIEVNKHPSHGPHPFNPENPDDIKLLKKLESDTKHPEWNKLIIDVWTKRDVLKHQTAKKNNLNYLTIY
jgi:hypothetical protein